MANRKKNHIKPSYSKGIITLKFTGEVTTEIEDLPDNNKELEKVVGKKFADVLAAKTGRKLEIIGLGEDPPDIIAKEDGKEFGVEITEVINAKEQVKEDLQSHYARKIYNLLRNESELLRGFSFSIEDGNQIKYPRVNTAKGKKIVGEFSKAIRQSAIDLKTMSFAAGVNMKKSCDLIDGQLEIRVVVSRLDSSSGEKYGINLYSPYDEGTPEEQKLFLWNTINKKLNKRWNMNMPTMLLVYENDSYRGEIQNYFSIARNNCNESPHGYFEIWYFFLDDIIEKIFPF